MSIRQMECSVVSAADREYFELFDMLLRNCEIGAGLYLGKPGGESLFREYVRPFYRDWWASHEACNGRIGRDEDADRLVMSRNLIDNYTPQAK